MNENEPHQASGTAGTLHLKVRYARDIRDSDGVRRSYRYQIDDDSIDGSVTGTDLYSGVGAPVDAHAALATLVSFVSAAGEAYGHTMRGGDSENLHLFRRGVAEAAYANLDELGQLALEMDENHDRPSSDGGPRPPLDSPSL